MDQMNDRFYGSAFSPFMQISYLRVEILDSARKVNV